jgi:hypothetical protein
MSRARRATDPRSSARRRLPDVFGSTAFLFGPADPRVPTAIQEATGIWSPPSAPDGVDVVLWGRIARNARPSLGLVPGAIAREVTIAALRAAPPGDLKLAELHRLPAVRRPGRLRGPIRAAILSGVLAELVRGDRPTRVIEAVVAEAGGIAMEKGLRPSGDGSALATIPMHGGMSAELRVARLGHPKAEHRGYAALLALEAAGVPFVPRPIAIGTTAGARWATETLLPGRHTLRLTANLVQEVTGLLLHLPEDPSPGLAVADQLGDVALAFPEHAHALETVSAAVERWSAGMPSVLVHGDLWLNNLLVVDGRLSGVFDWDTWHRAGIPGADLLNLLAADERTRSQRDIGPLLVSDFWASPIVVEALRPYFEGRGRSMPDRAGLAAIGTAWWASRIAASLDRGSRPTEHEAWVARNLVAPLDRLARLERELG